MRRILCCLLIAGCLYLAVTLLPGRSADLTAAYYLRRYEPVFITVWHVDTFEGGVNSRGGWLKARAAEYEKKNRGVYLLVSVLDPDTARARLNAGERPTLLSAGPGFLTKSEAAELIPSEDGNAAGAAQDVRAAPYAVGAYFLYRREEAKEPVTLRQIAELLPSLPVKRGKKTIPALVTAQRLLPENERISVRARSQDAYALFAADGAAALLGTQRDWFRLRNREIAFSAVPLVDESGRLLTDLIQYLYRFGGDERAAGFIAYLTDRETQKKLTGIGLMSPSAETLPLYDGGLGTAERILKEHGVSPREIFS